MIHSGQNIFINGRFLLQVPTGVQRFAYEICRALLACNVSYTIICPKYGNIHPAYDTTGMNIVRFGVGESHFWEQLILPLYFIGKKQYLVINFSGLGSLLIRNKIITIHDLSFLHNPSWFSHSYYYYYKPMTRWSARTAKHILTVSNFSKSEILNYYTFLHEDKVSVIYNAIDHKKFYPTASTDSQNYILAVSSIDPRKNFNRLLQAFHDVHGYTLKIVGDRNGVFRSGDVQDSENVQFLGRVTDEQLIELYRHAQGFIFPSLYEGFGLPPIEAMAIGCPVACSEIPVMQEICQDAAIMFDPTDIDSIRNSIKALIQLSNEQRNQMITQGFSNVQRFNWINSAKEIIHLIKNMQLKL